MSELIKGDVFENLKEDESYDDVVEKMEQDFLFIPEKGNVAFSSAYDCWSFTLPSFIPNVANQLGMN